MDWPVVVKTTSRLRDVSPHETRRSYHHGALREELIQACLALIEAEGIGAVSLRRVAREAGVSPGAPYHHFPDRAALLNAIAARGWEGLLARMTAARDDAGSPRDALGAILEAYVLHARENRAFAQVMYRPELAKTTLGRDAEALGHATLQLVADTVAEAQAAGLVPAGDPQVLVTLGWSLSAGLGMLAIEGALDRICAERGSTVPELVGEVAALFRVMLRA
jgi:AcrR family transcriptional regulator